MKQHPFTHLGPGPYRVADYEYKIYQAHHTGPVQPGASCDHCGTGIMHVYWIEGSDGKRFKVGSSCVFKTDDVHLVAQTRARKKIVDREARQIRKRRKKRTEIRECFNNFPGLHEALKTDHHITRDIRWKFRQYGSISVAQAELIFKIAKDVVQRKVERAEEDTRLIDVPEIDGRMTVTGIILTTKVQDSYYGSTLKMLVMVETDEGIFKLWGTHPDSLYCYDEDGRSVNTRGAQIRFDAAVTPKETGFGFFKRPTKATVLAIPLKNREVA